MSPREVFALRDYLSPELKGRGICDARHSVSLTDILSLTCLDACRSKLSGRSVMLAMSGQLLSGLAMIEIDGLARRMLLCPPDLNPDHLNALISDAGIDAGLVLEARHQNCEGEGIEARLVQGQIVRECGKRDVLLFGDLLDRFNDLGSYRHGWLAFFLS